jgi:hypothetical protein
MRNPEKRCLYCHCLYRPDPRTAAFQKACRDPACRRRRKKEAQTQFLRDNPGYFRGRYAQIKPWLDAHPGYWVAYSKVHPEYRRKNRLRERLRRLHLKRCPVHIQVTMLRRKARALTLLRGADIQDTIRLRLDGLLDAICRPDPVHIQVQTDFPAPAL